MGVPSREKSRMLLLLCVPMPSFHSYLLAARTLFLSFSSLGLTTSSLHLQAPGTFGFDGTKYRPTRSDFVSIPMDEFGRPAAPNDNTQSDAAPGGGGREDANGHPPTAFERQRQQSPSPAPFSHYAPPAATTAKVTLGGLQVQERVHGQRQEQQEQEAEAAGAGCCKCVIM